MKNETLLCLEGFQVLLTRKAIKNLYLRVDAQKNLLRISAPHAASERVIADFVRHKKTWIEKQLRKPVPSQRVYTAADRRAFRALCEAALARWEPVVGKRANGFSVRDMKSRWGSCNTKTEHLNFNLKLLDYPRECLDYVVCHELCHLWVPGHGARFWSQMDRVYPEWRAVRKMLR